jgi:hypothetical protein
VRLLALRFCEVVMFSKDLVERVVATFLQAALGVLSADRLFDLGVAEWKVAVAAGLAAALAVVKGAVAVRLGDGSASLVN